MVDDYIGLERGRGILSLCFGVTHHAVEQTRESLFGPRAVDLRHVPRTIAMHTANMGPHSRGWHLPYRVQWPIVGSDGLSLAVPEIEAFVQEIVVPYLALHRSAAAIRETYLLYPRHADVWRLAEQIVFAVDHLLGDVAKLEEHRETLLAQRAAPYDRRLVEQAFLTVKSQHAV